MSDPLVSLLTELVAIDSTSTSSNAPVVEVLERRLTAQGFTCERQRYVSDGVEKVNLLATLGDGLPELALVGHTDCVPFDPAWKEALTLTERDGRLYGRGACDTKGFIAAAVIAAERAKDELGKPLLLVFTADEELGCLGARNLLEAQKAKCRRAIIGEPTGLTPIRANKGYCLAEVTLKGKEGPSAYPDTGVSAIFHAARVVQRLEAFSLGALRGETDDAFSPPYATLNVGVIHGGKAKNIIPGECRFTLEWRPLPGQSVEAVLDFVRAALADLKKEDDSFDGTVTPLRTDHGYDTKKDADVVTFLAQKTGNAASTAAFGTEGPQFQALGATPVVFGPGDITDAHQTGENVEVAQLRTCADVLTEAVRHFCGRGG